MQILGAHLPDERPICLALQRVFGIGPALSQQICSKLQLHSSLLVKDLSEVQVNAISSHLSGMKIQNEKKRETYANIIRLRDIGSYRGRRHAMGYYFNLISRFLTLILSLPVNGQNTRSNAMTARKLNKVQKRMICIHTNNLSGSHSIFDSVRKFCWFFRKRCGK